ncbi:MAG: c-type cytochrome [Polyangiaceae bacterium]|jgi:cytochrome c oxidase cbb3-type subunit III
MTADDRDERDEKDEPRTLHVYDGDLQEEDNRLPLWWLYTLYGAIVFAAVYWYGEHQLKAWEPRDVAFQQEMVAVRLEEAKKNGGLLPDETLLAMSKTPATLEDGKQTFVTTCAPCHRADGGGNIGPNLTDDYWIHGSKPKNIFTCVHDGVAAKGMPTWGPQLGDAKVASVVAYVLSIKGTNVPGGKPPQGEKDM